MDPKALAARVGAYKSVASVRKTDGAKTYRSEVQRVLDLPTWDETAFDLDLTEKYRKPGGAQTLRPIQSKVLHFAEQGAEELRGVLGLVGAGGGKTLLSMLLPKALKAQRPLLILPAPLVENFHREYRKFYPHWQVTTNMRVATYSQLSVASGADFLVATHPDLIILDEAHNLARPDSARTKRFLRYCKQFPNTIVVPMSGTLTKRMLAEYAHFAELSLREGSPLPLNERELFSWGNVIDATGKPKDADFAAVEEIADFAAVEEIADFSGPSSDLDTARSRGDDDAEREAIRKGFRARLRSTPGVVCSPESEAQMGLRFVEWDIKLTPTVAEHLADLDRTWCRPDGEELASALDKAAVESQMGAGFYYRWNWPNGEVDTEWMSARRTWHREIRNVLKRDLPAFDSPLRVANGLIRGDLKDPAALAAFHRWKEVSHRRQPPTVAVWLDDYLERAALAWGIERLEKKENGIIWYEHNAVGAALRRLGIPTFGRDEEIPSEKGMAPPLIAASIKVHGTGKNLQFNFSNNLILTWQGMGAVMEQLLARTHRQGQDADEVLVYYPAHTRRARNDLRKSWRDAVYAEDSHGMKQKLLLGTWTNPSWRVEEDEEEAYPEEGV